MKTLLRPPFLLRCVLELCSILCTPGMLAPAVVLAEEVRYINQVAFFKRLREKRPDLAQWEKCLMTLRIRSDRRDEVLNTKKTFETIRDNEYPQSLRDVDNQWAEAHRKFQKEERAVLQKQVTGRDPWEGEAHRDELEKFKYYPGFYDLQWFISYQVGPGHPPYHNNDKFLYKSFFEFKNPIQDLTPELYRRFAEKLAANGFVGDTKVAVIFAWERHLFNSVIVHAPTTEQALIAEKTGLEVFGGKLSGYSRGVDVKDESFKNDDGEMDFHRYLCKIGTSNLPPAILRFVQHAERGGASRAQPASGQRD
ncbi:MAG: hypothetical protein C5B49_06805 [Bdellovibrio sp.]|nr:MAG: hypothetical protein C5B49_06805 [Bdellovibrio sp.]